MRRTILLCLSTLAIVGFVFGSDATAGPLQPSDELVSATTTSSPENGQVAPTEETTHVEEGQVQSLKEEELTVTSSSENTQEEQGREQASQNEQPIVTSTSDETQREEGQQQTAQEDQPATPPVEEVSNGEGQEQSLKEEQAVTTQVEEIPKEGEQEQPLNEQQTEPQQSEGALTGEPATLEEEIKNDEGKDAVQTQPQQIDLTGTASAQLHTDPIFDNIWQDVMRKTIERSNYEKLDDKVGNKQLNAVQVNYDEEKLRALVEKNSKMEIEPNHLSAEHKPGADEITLAYQSDCARLEHLERLAETWKGPISAAVLCTPDQMARLDQAKGHWAVKKYVNLHLCTTDSIPEHYPVNKMRNTGISHVNTRRLFLVDADEFVAFDESKARASVASAETNFPKEQYIYAVASFQWKNDPQGAPIPLNMDALKSNPNAVLRHPEFAPAYDPPGMGWENWKHITQPTQIKYAPDYEPYFVATRERAGLFDERFVGWGGNKSIHLAKLHYEGVQYAIMPGLFTFSDETEEIAHSHVKGQAIPGLYEDILGKIKTSAGQTKSS